MIHWTDTEQRWRDALLAAMVPPDPVERGLPGLGALPLDRFWSAFGDAAPPLLAFGLRASVLLLAVLGPLVFLRRWALLPSLSPDERDRLLDRAAQSRVYLVRQMVTTLKAVACFAYLRDVGVRLTLEAAP